MLSLNTQNFLDDVKDYLFSDFLDKLNSLDFEVISSDEEIEELELLFKIKIFDLALEYYEKAELSAKQTTQDMYYLAIDRRLFASKLKTALKIQKKYNAPEREQKKS